MDGLLLEGAFIQKLRYVCFRWIHDYQEACVDKLEKFIHGEINPQDRHPLTKGGSTEQMHGNAVFRMGSSTDYGSMEEETCGSKESLKGAVGGLSGTLGNPGHMTDHHS